MFKAILISKTDAAQSAQVTELDEARLPDGDVTVRVAYSTVNYKDGLAITGKGPVVRKFPMVPGIDLAGTVDASSDPEWKAGDEVVLNGWGLGEAHWGGLAQRARVKGAWLVAVPAPLTTRQAMAIGTAGYTAMLSVLALERHGVRPGDGDVLAGGMNCAEREQLGFEVAHLRRIVSSRDRTYFRQTNVTPGIYHARVNLQSLRVENLCPGRNLH